MDLILPSQRTCLKAKIKRPPFGAVFLCPEQCLSHPPIPAFPAISSHPPLSITIITAPLPFSPRPSFMLSPPAFSAALPRPSPEPRKTLFLKPAFRHKKSPRFKSAGFKTQAYTRSTYSMAEAAISSEAVAIPVKNMTDTKTKAAATTAANFLNISISPSGQTPFAHLLQVYSPKAQMSKCKL